MLDLVEAPFLDRGTDGCAVLLGEAEVDEPPRDLHVAHDVVDRDAFRRIVVDVLERTDDEPSGGSLHRRRFADGDSPRADTDDDWFGEGRKAPCGAIHHPFEFLRGAVALFLEVGTDAGKARLGVFADEPVVVHADHGNPPRDGQPGDLRGLQDLVRPDVGRGENGDRRRQRLQERRQVDVARIGMTDDPVAFRGMGECRAADERPPFVLLGRDVGVGEEASLFEEVVEGGFGDGLGIVADEGDVVPAFAERMIVEVHHDGGDVRLRQGEETAVRVDH